MLKITVKEWKEKHGYNPLMYYLMDLKNKTALRNDDLIDEGAKEGVDVKVLKLHPG
ncbi:MAG: hypothetical protein ACFFCD_00395 [Promethearchaeota archaeon]